MHKKGTPKTKNSGRKKGTPNKLTVAAKQAFSMAFEGLGGVKALTAWAKTNKTEFFKLYAKLIPVDLTSGEKELGSMLFAPERFKEPSKWQNQQKK